MAKHRKKIRWPHIAFATVVSLVALAYMILNDILPAEASEFFKP